MTLSTKQLKTDDGTASSASDLQTGAGGKNWHRDAAIPAASFQVYVSALGTPGVPRMHCIYLKRQTLALVHSATYIHVVPYSLHISIHVVYNIVLYRT